MLLVLNLPLVGLWAKALTIPPPLMYAGILVFATVGIWGASQSWVDLLLLYTIGVVGLVMRLFDFPAAPVIVGMVLGPIAEQEFRRALTVSQGDLTIFLTKPLSATLLALAVILIAAPPAWRLVRRLRAGPVQPALR
jgi:putative tricarboxylic transport membrane protein